ncbi:capsid protein [Nitratireductor pacificus]|nr:capsid protein [Nitratireductor pacificus]
MSAPRHTHWPAFPAAKPSPRTRHTELLRLCARIGYSPPVSA